MPTYRLEPVRGAEHHHYWTASLIPPVTAWVRATSPMHARRRMQEAARDGMTGDKPFTPWTDTALVRCVEDGSRPVPADLAIFANGQITLKLRDRSLGLPASENRLRRSFAVGR